MERAKYNLLTQVATGQSRGTGVVVRITTAGPADGPTADPARVHSPVRMAGRPPTPSTLHRDLPAPANLVG